MARKIKRFFVFMFFSLFFTVSSKKIQSTETASEASTCTSAKGVKSPNPVSRALSSVVGVKSAEAAGCTCGPYGWTCD